MRSIPAVNVHEVIRDPFSTMGPPLTGYGRIVWVVGRLDNGHWDEQPETVRE